MTVLMTTPSATPTGESINSSLVCIFSRTFFSITLRLAHDNTMSVFKHRYTVNIELICVVR